MAKMSSYYDSLPNFSAINKSVAWATDPTLPKLLEETYLSIIRSKDERPYVEIAYHALSEIVGYNKRLNVAYNLKDRLLSYFQSRYVEGEDLKKIDDDFESLIHYLQVLDRAAGHSEAVNKLYKNNPKTPVQRLDAIVYFFVISKDVEADDFLWFSQALFHYVHIVNKPIETTLLPIYAYSFKDKIIAYPAINFCLSLIEAMELINKMCYPKSCPAVTVKSFPGAKRNMCFDKYVDIQAQKELKILLEDNDKKEVSNLYDAKYELLDDERTVFDEYENDPDSHPEAVKMAKYLIERLEDDLGIDEKEEDNIISQRYCTYIVPGALKSRDEIEADLREVSKRSAQRFARRLIVYEGNGYLDFYGDTPKEVYEYLKKRYRLTYSQDHFIRYFRPE